MRLFWIIVGIDVNSLDFSVPVSIANGQTMSARTMIDGSLLGMNFLDRLSAYTVRGNKVILID